MSSTLTTSPSGQHPKVLIATALIAAATTIGVSFVGVFPQLRNSDAKRYEELQMQFDDLKKKSLVTLPAAPDKTMTVTGTVYSAPDMKRTLSGVEVYLLPDGNNLLTAKTDDTGRFGLRDVPQGTYSIIVRDSIAGRSGKGILDDSDDQINLIGASIKYRIRKN